MGKLTAGILAAGAVAALALAPSAAGSVLVVGDSLGVGSAPHLRAALGGTAVDVDAEPGRTSAQGVGVLARRVRPEHEVVVFPLGTNDTSPDAFAASLASAGRIPARRALLGLAAALRRAVGPVAAALRDARTAATKAEPEPVLGAP